MNQNEFDDFFFDLKDLGCEILFNHKGMYYIHREGLGEAGWYKSLSDAIKSGHYSGNNEKYSPKEDIIYTVYNFKVYYPKDSNMMQFDLFKEIVDDIEVAVLRIKDETDSDQISVKPDSNCIDINILRPSIQLHDPVRLNQIVSGFNRRWGSGDPRTQQPGFRSFNPIDPRYNTTTATDSPRQGPVAIQIQCLIDDQKKLHPDLILNVPKKGAGRMDDVYQELEKTFNIRKEGSLVYLDTKDFKWYTLL